MKKVVAIILAMLLCVSGLTACSSSGGETSVPDSSTETTANAGTDAAVSSDAGTVVWWTWSTEATEAYQEIVALFNKQYPNIKVDLQFISNADYWTKLPIAIAGGTGPDIYQMTRPSFELYAASNQAADLSSYIESSDTLKANLAAMDSKLVETYQFDGTQMAVPYTVESSVIAYNKDLFKAAGIQEPKEIEDTWTWEDLAEIAEKLTIKGDNGETEQYGFMVPADRMPTWEKIWSHGVEMFNENKDASTLADPAIVDALQPFVDMYQKGVSPTTDSTATMSSDDMFMTGKIAMLAAGSWKVPTYRGITGFDWDVAELPFDSETGKRVSSSNVLGFVVNPYSKEIDNTVKFLEVATSPEAQHILAEKGIYIPANSGERDPYFETTETTPSNLLAFKRALAYLHPNTLSQYVPYAQFGEEYANGLKDAYNGTKTLQEALQDTQDILNKIMDENKKIFSAN